VFVFVFAVHLDEALAVFAQYRRDTRTQSPIADKSSLPVELSPVLPVVSPMSLLLAVLLGATLGRALLGNPDPAGPVSILDVVGLLTGALVGGFTWIKFERMMWGLRNWLLTKLRLLGQATKPAEESTTPPGPSSWSTLLTTWRTRRITRSSAASAPCSATSRC
jgi:hypothetical protein